ncbi:hypothetical protein ASF36_24595 [Methylobacterium sp. Leaf90]|nr:hypothetical protein ASF36_24595 [Methylobacterium sp. Leaf90]
MDAFIGHNRGEIWSRPHDLRSAATGLFVSARTRRCEHPLPHLGQAAFVLRAYFAGGLAN